MTVNQQSSGKIRVNFRQAIGLLTPYIKKRIVEQVRAVAVITLFLVLFQTIVLRIAIAEAAIISCGIGLVIMGLAFFMEGLFLGIMPLGELIGVKLPQKSKLPIILIFSFILGMGATFAEPAIGILKAAGFSVKPWDAPLLFLLLNRGSTYLVLAVGVGVGFAVLFGTLRFLYSWSIKPFLYILAIGLVTFSVAISFEPNLRYLTGVAWDCGGVTTGPVTVPLVLALGIGICRIVGSASSGAAGFGVVSLASLFPIFTVLLLGLPFLGSVPKPSSEADFFKAENRAKAVFIFKNQDDMIGYALQNGSVASQSALFDNDTAKMSVFLSALANDPIRQQAIFGSQPNAFKRWAALSATVQQRLVVFGTLENAIRAVESFANAPAPPLDIVDAVKRNSFAAVQAVLPLCLFLALVLLILLREKIPRADEVILGVFLGLVGMSLFNLGIEFGLSKIGAQVGSRVPASFKAIDLVEDRETVRNFDTSVVQTAITSEGKTEKFFFSKSNGTYRSLPFKADDYDPALKQFTYVPTKGPLFGRENGFWGILVVLLFAFALGYGATLAEPALNALGRTVEELTVGIFKKDLIIQSVAVGVGIGMMFGLLKVIWGIPLWIMLVPSYAITLILTAMADEDFVSIAWDSGGVTTGPITVPLVLAMGLGVGTQLGVVEGFGILAMASVWPILITLLVGQVVKNRRKATLKASGEGVAV